ncbi:MAG: ABC transporter permease [Planctomycetaceae bacterium]
MILKDPMLWRIVWKEYRAQRSFWLAVAGAGIGLMLLTMGILDRAEDRATMIWGIAVSLGAFYALGSASVLFASEREEGTIELLRIMAARSSRVFIGKVGFCLASALLIVGLLVASAAGLTWYAAPSGQIYDPERARFAAWLTAGFLVWGIFCSAIFRKVLTAVCFAAALPFVLMVAGSILHESVFGRPGFNFGDLDQIGVGLLLIPLDAVMVSRMLAGRSLELHLPRMLPLWTPARSGVRWLADAAENAPAWRRLFTRLLWLEFRQAASVGHLIWLACVFLLVFVPFPALGRRSEITRATIAVVVVPLLLGVWTFQADSGRRTRFLAEQGIVPSVVWLSRQLVWLFIGAVVVGPFLIALDLHSRNLPPGAAPPLHILALLACSGYLSGQFASMLVPRSVTAGFVGALLFAVLGAWLGLMTFIEVPLRISVVPLLAVLILATLAWSRNWLFERATWRSWLTLAGGLGLALVAVWGAVGRYRLQEVPGLESVWWPTTIADFTKSREELMRPPTDDELETARMYERAVADLPQTPRSSYVPEWETDMPRAKSAVSGWEFATPQERDLLAAHRDALELALAATARESCAFFDPSRPQAQLSADARPTDRCRDLATLILLSARELESEGRLGEALDRYVAALRLARHVANRGSVRQWWVGWGIEAMVVRWIPQWAVHPDQTSWNLFNASTRLLKEVDRMPPLQEAVGIVHLALRQAIEGDWADIEPPNGANYPPWFRGALHLMPRIFPWERSRALRVLDLVAVSQTQCLDVLNAALNDPATDVSEWAEFLGARSAFLRPDPTILRRLSGVVSWTVASRAELLGAATLRGGVSDQVPWKYAATTPILSGILPTDNYGIWHPRLEQELSRRALALELALIAWKQRHGAYPNRLDELAGVLQPSGVWPESILDPYSGREFGYRSAGFPTPVMFPDGPVQSGDTVLWSAGPTRARVVPVQTKQGAVEFKVADWNGIPAKGVPPAYSFSLP